MYIIRYLLNDHTIMQITEQVTWTLIYITTFHWILVNSKKPNADSKVLLKLKTI
jgi:hypothetical protein